MAIVSLPRTDHRSLNWLKSFKEPEGQLARWLQVLEQYDFEVLHRPGAKHLNADALSREPCRQCGHDEVWLPQWFRQELAEAQAQDSELNQVISWITTRSWPVDFPSHYSHPIQALWAQRHSLVMSEGVLNRKWEDVMNNGAEQHLQVVLPKQLRDHILHHLHDHQLSGAHLGQDRTFKKIQQRFYWVGQRKDIRDWCEKCWECATRKPLKQKRRASLESVKAAYPFQVIAMDIMGPLPCSNLGNKYVLVVEDYF